MTAGATRLRDNASREHLREQTAYDGGIVKVADNRPASGYAARRINSPTMPLLLYAFIGCCLVVISGVTAKRSYLEYAVIIDAGSTGSRVRVYSWHERASSTYKLPRFNLTLNYKVKPGISSYAKNLNGLKSHVHDLILRAKKFVPKKSVADTPIYLLATAGKYKRLLNVVLLLSVYCISGSDRCVAGRSE